MTRQTRIFAFIAALVAAPLLAACGEEEQGTAEQLGESLDETVEQAGEKAQEATEELERQVE